MTKINIAFPDGNIKEFDINSTGFDIANSISKSLAKASLAIKINGNLWDLSRQIPFDAKIELITNKSDEALEIIRHDAAHIMAQSVQELFKDVQVTIGPATKDGFYYDFATKEPFSLEDLPRIERQMQKIIKRNEKLQREVWNRNKAIEFFEEKGEKYKAEIIKDLPESEEITLYRQGDFIDLCRGPHLPSTSYVKHFKLLKLAGAYWRGNSDNEMLQRIYGTAFLTADDLEQYLHYLEEAEKRDHRKLGKELDFFHIQEEATGSVFWHEKGYELYRIIEEYIRKKIKKNGYIEVKTPQLIDRVLWEKSGHWDKFKENMFIAESGEGRTLAIKPMNCPAHVQIFNQKLTSYRDLPLRMSEFGCCHRNESSGSLHGIMRVRAFTQDDAHIFCEEHQINDETVAFCQLLQEVYKDFGFNNVKVKFSTRPEVRAGNDETWDKAENSLREAVQKAGLEYEINEGEGAFYGPKLEFTLIDAIGRQWQCGTLQVDFIMPTRLDATYIASDGSKKHPVMLHRAILGTFERFIGILIENTAGALPLWLSPVQMVVTTISNKFDDYAKDVLAKLQQNNFRAKIDLRSEKINYKIREHSLQKIPYILIIGEKEVNENKVSIREFGSKKEEVLSLNEFINKIA
ncbi:threonine--tRNA ligase [Rickettsiales bacterium]|nr:threonine--tRNA ligase [Rickettsiales bacterium]